MPRYDDRYGSTRLYVGRLSSRTRSRDLEDLFSRYGRVRDVDMKHDFAFVEFSDPRDADDARYSLNGREFGGSRIIVEFAKGGPRGPSGSREYLGRGPPPGSGRCFNCGIDGHWARDCKAGDWKNKCYRCGERGHIERNCQNSPKTLKRGRSYSRSRSTSRSRNRSRSRSLSKSRSSSRSRSTSRSRSRSRSRSSSRSLSKSRNRSRSMSRRAQPLDGVAITELYHRFHKRHKLKWLENQTPYECSGCKEPGHGPRYGCTKSSCNFNLHWDCTFTTFHASHHFYENCQLKFFDHPQESKKGRKCDACLRDIQGFVYHCENGRKYHQCCTGNDLHPTCRNLPPVREITVDDEAVIFRLAKKMKEKCALCGEKHPANGEKYRAKGWSYVSACKTYHLHVACVAHVRNQSAVQRMERKTNLPVVVRNKGGRSSKYWKIIKFAAEFIMSLLSGNPASLAFTLLEPLLQDLLSDMKL